MGTVVAAEFYRTPDQNYDEQDYMVDGMILFRLQEDAPPIIVDEGSSVEDVIEKMFTPFLKQFIEQCTKAPAEMAKRFPKFFALRSSGRGFWFKVTTDETLASKPKEFHGNSFSEAELLGVTEPGTSHFEVLFNSVGDRIEGHPDKFMLNMGAV